MNEKESKALDKMFGKITTETLNVEGFKEPVPFDIYDGYAVGYTSRKNYIKNTDKEDGESVLDMEYPILKCVKDNKEFSDAVIDYVGTISSVEEITPIHVLLTFNRLFRDGVEITPDKL